MDKIKLNFELPKEKTIEYNDTKFTIQPFIGMSEQVFLIRNYIEDYFGISENPLIVDSEYNYIEAQFKLKNYICQLLTNIDTENIIENVYVDPVFWELISSNIENYCVFEKNLEKIIEEIKEQLVLKNSIGKVIQDFAEKLYDTLEKFSEMTPEDLEKIQKQGVDLIERLEKSSLLGPSEKEE